MPIALFSAASLLAPLHSLLGWFIGPAPAADMHRALRPDLPTTLRPAVHPAVRPAVRQVRVLRVAEARQPPGSAGRMVISGRMADVCAELDRLAAAQACAPRR